MITSLLLAASITIPPLDEKGLIEFSTNMAIDACRVEFISQVYKIHPELTLEQVQQLLIQPNTNQEMLKCVNSVGEDIYNRILKVTLGGKI